MNETDALFIILVDFTYERVRHRICSKLCPSPDAKRLNTNNEWIQYKNLLLAMITLLE